MPLSPDCIEFLGLRCTPFDALPGESFLYSDSILEENLRCARTALLEPGVILLLTGPGGVGLSTQLMRILSHFSEDQELVALRARQNTRFESIDETLRGHLRTRGLDHPDRSLRDLLGARLAETGEMTLAIDDAHLLGTDILGLLFRLRSEVIRDHGLAIRLILCGNPVLLRRRLPLDPDDHSPVARCNLHAFNLEQTKAYLETRLRAAGYPDPKLLLNEEVVAELQDHSEGLPGRLNGAADIWLAALCSHAGQRRAQATGTSTAQAHSDTSTGPSATAFVSRAHEIPTQAPLFEASEAPPSEPKPALQFGSSEASQSGTQAAPQSVSRDAAQIETMAAPKSGSRDAAQIGTMAAPAFEPRDAAESRLETSDGARPETITDLGSETATEVGLELSTTGSGRIEPSISSMSTSRDADQEPIQDFSGLRAEDPDRIPSEHSQSASHSTTFWNRRWFVPALAVLFALAILTPLLPRLFERPPTSPTTIELPLPPESTLASTSPTSASGGEVSGEFRELLFDEPELATVDEPEWNAEPTPSTAAPTPARASAPASAPASATASAPVSPPASVPAPVPAAPTATATAPARAASAPAAAAATATTAAAAPAAAPAPAQLPSATTRSTSQPTTPISADLSADRAWIQRQEGRHLTIQLLAARDLQTAQEFVNRHGLTGVRLIETRSGERDFVVVLAGSFSNRNAADAALIRLPEAVRALEPWIRSIDSVRENQR